MKEKHYFAGSNASKGLHSYFDSVFNPQNLNHLYILKGGPGVGKNYFMKKFADKMKEKNYSIEYIHCASDNVSLDGIIIPEIKVAFVDGTAPHPIDPKIPGVVDEIINLGAYLNNKELEKHKNQILQVNRMKSRLYKSAFKYFEAASIILEEINSIYDEFIDEIEFNKLCNETIEKLFINDSLCHIKGKETKMFAEAYTANGFISYTKSLCEDKRVWAVVGEDTNYTSKLIELVAEEAKRRGHDIECYYRPLESKKLQHVYIPSMNLIIITAENPLSYEFDKVIDIHSIMDLDKLKNQVSEIENNLNLYELLIKNAIKKLSQAKKQHELQEVFYTNSMDFGGVDECFEKVLKKHT